MGSTNSCLHRPPGGLSGHEELRAKHRFRKVTGKEHMHLTQEKFFDLLGPSPCTEGLFKYVDADGDGTISFDEIHKEITAFRAMKSPEAKLRVGIFPRTRGSFLFLPISVSSTLSLTGVTVSAIHRNPRGIIDGAVLYNFYDSNHDGKLSRSEVADAMVVACGQALPQTQVEQLVSSTMDMFDTDKDGFLNFSEFSTLMVTSGLELS